VTVNKQALEKNGVGGLMLPSAEPRLRAEQNGLEPSLIIIICDLSSTFFCYECKCLFLYCFLLVFIIQGNSQVPSGFLTSAVQ
jgi:hypothetical protein